MVGTALSLACRRAAKQMAHALSLVASPRTRQNPFVAAIVLLNALSPSKLAGELEVFGHTVWEALAVSEVLFLCEQHSIDAVIIAAEVEQGELIEKQLRGIVMRMDNKANASYVDWELSQLFPKKDMTIQ